MGIVIQALISFLIGSCVYMYINRVIAILPEGIEREDMTKEEYRALNRDKRKRLFSLSKSKEKKGKRERLIILAGGVIGLLIYGYYGWSASGVTVFFVYAILTAIAVIDMDTQYIPPELNVLLAVAGVISIATIPGPTLVERCIGAICVSVPLLLITLIIPEGFGGGDIKMMAAVGILLGWKGCVAAFMLGLLLGGAYGAFVLIAKKKGRKEHFAFGPFLAIGVAVALYADIGVNFMTMYIQYIMAAFQPY